MILWSLASAMSGAYYVHRKKGDDVSKKIQGPKDSFSNAAPAHNRCALTVIMPEGIKACEMIRGNTNSAGSHRPAPIGRTATAARRCEANLIRDPKGDTNDLASQRGLSGWGERTR